MILEKKIDTKSTNPLHENRLNREPETLSWWQILLPPSLISLFTIAFYYPSLNYPFQFDDLANISKKFDIRFLKESIFFSGSRWVGELINRINYQMGRFDPWYYRTTNLGIHLITGLLVFALIYQLCRLAKSDSFPKTNKLSLASLTAALFLLHPVQTQTISYVIQARLEGLAGLFTLAAIFAFITAYSTQSSLLRFVLLTFSLAIGVISSGTKEIVIMAPFLMILADWFFLAQERWDSLKSRFWFHALFTLIVFGGLLYFKNPSYLTDVLGFKLTSHCNRGNIITENASDLITPLHYMISEFKVILHYLWVFISPFDMSVEYDWKLSANFFSPDSFFPFFALLIIVITALRLAYTRTHSYIAFGLLWFFVTIAPRSSIIPSPELICDYKTYLASVGWLFVVASAIIMSAHYLYSLGQRNPLRFLRNYQLQTLIMIMISLGLGAATLSRNTVWSTSVLFWHDVVVKAPTKARAYNNLGVALSEEQRFAEAIPNYLKAIQLDHFYSDPWSNLAVAYSVGGDDDKAISALKEAIRIFPYYPEAYNNLGSLIMKKKDFPSAEFFLSKAIELRPYYGKAHFNLGRVYYEKKEFEKAWGCFKRATQGDLDTAEGFLALGQISMQLKKFPEACQAFAEVLNHGRAHDPASLFNLANALYLAGNFKEAQNLFKLLVDKNPNEARFSFNYAEALYSNKDFNEALNYFKKIAAEVKELPTAHLRVANCYEQLGDFEQAVQYLSNLLKNNQAPSIASTARNELSRIMLQLKIKKGNGSVNMSEINNYVNSLSTTNTHSAAKTNSAPMIHSAATALSTTKTNSSTSIANTETLKTVKPLTTKTTHSASKNSSTPSAANTQPIHNTLKSLRKPGAISTAKTHNSAKN